MFKVNNKNTRTTLLTLFWCFYCQLWIYFTCFSSVFVVEFEQVNDSKEHDLLIIKESKTEISCQQTYLSNHSSKQLFLLYLTCTAANVTQNNKFFHVTVFSLFTFDACRENENKLGHLPFGQISTKVM